MNEPSAKACRRCGIRKPLGEFCQSKRNKDGRGSYCRSCDRARSDARLEAKQVVRQAPVGTRVCRGCGQEKPAGDFYFLGRGRDGLNPRCKVCVSSKGRRDYRRSKARLFIFGYLRTHPCADCGEDDPVVLEFDHRDGTQKLFTIGDPGSRSRRRLDTLTAEIAKCDVRCANCHRRRTAAARGFWTDLLTERK